MELRDTILQGDVLDVLRGLPDGCVQTCVTSPPYWGLRDYGLPPSVWDADPGCEHVWGAWQERHDERENTQVAKTRTTDRFYGDESRRFNGNHQKHSAGAFCDLCGAWRGCLGLEPTPQLYVQHMVAIFAEVRRVLRKDGTLWLNLGDSYAGSWGNYAPGGIKSQQRPQTEEGKRWERKAYGDTKRKPPTADARGLKPKDLCGIPWRVAFGLQDDGWWLRSDIVWAKSNPMPESVTDRPTKSHEYLFLLAKSARYYYDADAIREPAEYGYCPGGMRASGRYLNQRPGQDNSIRPVKSTTVSAGNGGSRNKRSVWTIATAPFAEAHFATFPPKLIEPCILAGSSAKACETCGAPWARTTVRGEPLKRSDSGGRVTRLSVSDAGQGTNGTGKTTLGRVPNITTHGWQPTCRCEHNTGSAASIVLDPFMGSGSTGYTARLHSRHYLGIELNPDYIEMAERRIGTARQPHLWTA